MWYDHLNYTNGIYFTPGLGPPSGDMAEWVVELTEGNWSETYAKMLSTSYMMELPTQRGVEYILDWSAELPFIYLITISMLIFPAGFLISVVLALTHRELYVAGILAGIFSLSTILRFVTGLGLILVNKNWILSYSIWMVTPQVCCLPLFLILLQFVCKASSSTAELWCAGLDSSNWYPVL